MSLVTKPKGCCSPMSAALRVLLSVRASSPHSFTAGSLSHPSLLSMLLPLKVTRILTLGGVTAKATLFWELPSGQWKEGVIQGSVSPTLCRSNPHLLCHGPSPPWGKVTRAMPLSLRNRQKGTNSALVQASLLSHNPVSGGTPAPRTVRVSRR